MKKSFLLIFFTFLGMAGPAQAQWQKGAFHGFKKVSVRSIAPHTLATQRAVNQALRNKTNILLKSTFTLKPAEALPSRFDSFDNLHASAFVFEENYNGKTYLWGATASHYFLEKPILQVPQTGEEFPVQFIAQGHHGMNDVSLFLIPSQLQGKLNPFKLAPHSPQKKEKLYSAGYFDDGFQVEKNRVVKDILPTRIVTSLVIEDKLTREGACGGPVLNKKEEIVGMHVGSSDKKQAGFVVPVEYIYEVLQAYHNNGKSLRPFYFNGRKLGEINVNEYIQSIEVWKENKLSQEFISYPRRAYLDYEHLEKFVDASHADKIVFIIERIPFSMLEKDQRSHRFKITYDLRTFHVSERQKQ